MRVENLHIWQQSLLLICNIPVQKILNDNHWMKNEKRRESNER